MVRPRIVLMIDVLMSPQTNLSFRREWPSGNFWAAYWARTRAGELADELAAAASLLMGQAAEGRPIVHIRGFRGDAARNDASALIRPKDQDMFR